jgi:hypothetical protein
MIITPDPRLRSPDRMINVDIFLGDFRKKKEKFKVGSKLMLGDPRKRQVEFLSDINTINW